MKIAILARIVNAKSGSRAAIGLARGLAKNNQVLVLAQRTNLDRQLKKDLEKIGAKVTLIKNWIKLPVILKKEKIEIISSHAPLLPTLMAKLSGIPIVYTYVGTQFDAYLERQLPYQKPNIGDKILNWLVNQLVVLLMRLRLASAQRFVANSHYSAEEAKRLYGKKAHAIYFGVDSEPFKSKLNQKSTQSIGLLSVSRFTPYKGFHVLIRVFKKLKKDFPKLKLVLVGSSSQKKYLTYLKKTKGKNVKILNNISDRKLAKQYQKADIYLSWDRYLFFGLPVLEAALFGKPAVVLNRCAAPEVVIQGKTGFLVENEKELSESLKKIIKDKNLRNQMGIEANKQTKNFTWKICVQKYENIFQEILTKN